VTSHRREQIAATLRRALQQVLARGLSDPRATGAMITLTGVDVSPDLRQAIANVSVLPEKKESLVLHALRHASAHLRRQAGELVDLKQMPQLTFELDRTLKQQAEVFDALAKVAREREARERTNAGEAAYKPPADGPDRSPARPGEEPSP
jgi:ribosome-binding factor A